MGALASFLLFILYMGILTVLNSLPHAIEQFITFLPWILTLTIAFGIQVALYFWAKGALIAKHRKMSSKTAAASAGVSTTSMILCCLHHITDVLPIIGLSAATIFLIQYQTLFMLLGIFSSTIGILMMLEVIQKNKLSSHGIFKAINMNSAKKIAIMAGVAILLLYAIILFATMPQSESTGNATTNEAALQLATKTNNANSLQVDITPANFSFGKEINFGVKFTTHSGSLDYDFAKISTLYDDKGNSYPALLWTGPIGGHHISGTLTFPKISQGAKSMKLIMKNLYNEPERIFIWELG